MGGVVDEVALGVAAAEERVLEVEPVADLVRQRLAEVVLPSYVSEVPARLPVRDDAVEVQLRVGQAGQVRPAGHGAGGVE